MVGQARLDLPRLLRLSRRPLPLRLEACSVQAARFYRGITASAAAR
ncbi:Hypothetical protein CAP_2995 [Chondromyces apiculatus DSM 436]|uniref:Uncharacterized protein n=1 Tax=Chondromyces apiculatus DSM 436 TaxID=1192034 RepID=A0A017TA53_9BACT|nr:Hypothetical protein CAP_2995 [Chondromyces apiculatus DSM 436]